MVFQSKMSTATGNRLSEFQPSMRYPVYNLIPIKPEALYIMFGKNEKYPKSLDFSLSQIQDLPTLARCLAPRLFRGFHFFVKNKKNTGFLSKSGVFYGCGGRTRTYDLRVMSPTSFQLLYSAIFGALPECLYILARRCAFVKF